MAELSVVKPPASVNMLSYVGDTQGCGTIRIIFPHLLLPHLRIEGYKFSGFYSAYFVNEINYYRNFTFVQFQRAATERHLHLIKNFQANISKSTKTPIVYEIDDLITDIPDWNHANPYYSKNKDYVFEIIKHCYGVTTSTQKLAEIYSKYNQNVIVIPNHLPRFMWGDIKPKHLNEPNTKKPRILWAGSFNHFCIVKGQKGGDFGPKLLDFIKKTVDDYQWVIIGGIPQELSGLKGKIEYHDFKNIFGYPSFMKSLNIDFAIAPLQQGIFNECKSNIKMLEYTATGVPGIYSKIEPYKAAHLQCTTDDEIIGYIEVLAKDVDMRKIVFEADHFAVKDLLWWEDDNFQNLRLYLKSYMKLFGKELQI